MSSPAVSSVPAVGALPILGLLGAILSVQVGAAFAKGLFPVLGAEGPVLTFLDTNAVGSAHGCPRGCQFSS